MLLSTLVGVLAAGGVALAVPLPKNVKEFSDPLYPIGDWGHTFPSKMSHKNPCADKLCAVRSVLDISDSQVKSRSIPAGATPPQDVQPRSIPFGATHPDVIQPWKIPGEGTHCPRFSTTGFGPLKARSIPAEAEPSPPHPEQGPRRHCLEGSQRGAPTPAQRGQRPRRYCLEDSECGTAKPAPPKQEPVDVASR